MHTADLEMMKLACDHFRKDIEAHWTQASFFAVIQGAFITLFASTLAPLQEHSVQVVNPRFEYVLLPLAGGGLALLWYLMARGRESYIREWRAAVVHLDGVVDRHRVYQGIEAVAAKDHGNPTRLTTWTPVFLMAFWLISGILVQFFVHTPAR